jgi:hypothetical protein
MTEIIKQWLADRGICVLEGDVMVLASRLKATGCKALEARILDLETKCRAWEAKAGELNQALKTSEAACAEMRAINTELETRAEDARKFLDARSVQYPADANLWHVVLDYAIRCHGELAVHEVNNRNLETRRAEAVKFIVDNNAGSGIIWHVLLDEAIALLSRARAAERREEILGNGLRFLVTRNGDAIEYLNTHGIEAGPNHWHAILDDAIKLRAATAAPRTPPTDESILDSALEILRGHFEDVLILVNTNEACQGRHCGDKMARIGMAYTYLERSR